MICYDVFFLSLIKEPAPWNTSKSVPAQTLWSAVSIPKLRVEVTTVERPLRPGT
jgi:hypothetical protein